MGQCRTFDADVTFEFYYGDYSSCSQVLCFIILGDH